MKFLEAIEYMEGEEGGYNGTRHVRRECWPKQVTIFMTEELGIPNTLLLTMALGTPVVQFSWQPSTDDLVATDWESDRLGEA